MDKGKKELDQIYWEKMEARVLKIKEQAEKFKTQFLKENPEFAYAFKSEFDKIFNFLKYPASSYVVVDRKDSPFLEKH